MKKAYIILFFLLGLSTTSFAQDDAIQKFFSKYMEDDRFSRVYISPKMMQMAGGFLKSSSGGDEEAQELGRLISKVKGIRILSADGIEGMPLYKEAMSTLNRNQYEELMDVQEKGTSLKFMIREEAGLIRELMMITGDTKSFTLLSMLGAFTFEDLNMLAEKTNIPGMDKYGKGSKGPKGPK
jgi:vacuolar-type H+-ATPase subunit F/Vma7